MFTSIAAGLTGAPLIAALLIAVMGGITLAVMKWAIEGDTNFNVAQTLIGLLAGFVMSAQFDFFAGFAAVGLATPLSAVPLALIAILSLVMLTLIIFDYLYSAAWRPSRREEFV